LPDCQSLLVTSSHFTPFPFFIPLFPASAPAAPGYRHHPWFRPAGVGGGELSKTCPDFASESFSRRQWSLARDGFPQHARRARRVYALRSPGPPTLQGGKKGKGIKGNDPRSAWGLSRFSRSENGTVPFRRHRVDSPFSLLFPQGGIHFALPPTICCGRSATAKTPAPHAPAEHALPP